MERENKGKREEKVKLHPVVVEHLKKLAGFDPSIFPWNHDRTTLMVTFLRIQEAAGIKLPCSGNHKHTRHCHVYGFHEGRAGSDVVSQYARRESNSQPTD